MHPAKTDVCIVVSTRRGGLCSHGPSVHAEHKVRGGRLRATGSRPTKLKAFCIKQRYGNGEVYGIYWSNKSCSCLANITPTDWWALGLERLDSKSAVIGFRKISFPAASNARAYECKCDLKRTTDDTDTYTSNVAHGIVFFEDY